MNLESPAAIEAELLVIGYGNSLRRDDGVGPRVAEAIEALNLPGVQTLVCQLLSPEHAEETLMDAVRGAKLHPWHRDASTGFFAEKVFRDADTIEQLARLGRSKRLQSAQRAQGQGSPPFAALGRSRPVVVPVRASVHAAQMPADMAAIFGKAFADRLAAS